MTIEEAIAIDIKSLEELSYISANADSHATIFNGPEEKKRIVMSAQSRTKEEFELEMKSQRENGFRKRTGKPSKKTKAETDKNVTRRRRICSR
jgi:hypothetical protein